MSYKKKKKTMKNKKNKNKIKNKKKSNNKKINSLNLLPKYQKKDSSIPI